MLSSSCNIPDSAQGYSLNFTVVPKSGGLGFLTVWPTGKSRPLVSTLNDLTGTVVANAAIVPAGTGGAIGVYANNDTDLIIDIDGYFAPSSSGPDALSLYTLAPCRVLDTRQTTGTFSGMIPVNVLQSACAVPSAQAYVLNATVVPQNGHLLGYLTLWPDTESKPVVSTLNAVDGAITSNMAIVPTLNGSIDAYATNPTDMVLDIFSYFAPIGTLKIMNTSLPSGTVNYTYSTALAAAGGVAPYAWSIASGSLPPGLNPNGNSGVISGTPTIAGTYPFTLQVTDSQSPPATASVPLSIAIDSTLTQLRIVTTSLPSGTQNITYGAMLAATGGITPYTWSITAGTLPRGLSLNSSTGTITGTPSGGGISSFTVKVTDSNNPHSAASAALSITVSPAVSLRIISTSLGTGNVGVPYSANVTAAGGVYPYTWEIASGSLPTGLSLNTSTGVITGTPIVKGTSNFGVQVTDSETPPVTASAQLSITINPGIVIITTTSLPNGTVGSFYSATLTASGGLTPYTWSIISGTLPDGLQLNASSGAITGTPTTVGTATFTVQVADSESPPATASAPLSITSNGPTRTFTLLHSFAGPEGSNPAAPLVHASDGNFYGTTYSGGANGGGTIFKITPSGTLTAIYDFCAQSNCPDGANPAAMVQARDGNFYGVTVNGGGQGKGTAFRFTPSGTLTTLYNFCAQTHCTDGESPANLMQASDGNFYGVNAIGGVHYVGDFYQLKSDGTMTVLYSFESVNGKLPYAALVQGPDGQLYGTAPSGGTGVGTVFKITLSGTLTLLYDFCSLTGCGDGGKPHAGLVLGSDGNFYGTTSEGGSTAGGTVFKITPEGTLTMLHAFILADGFQPTAGLVQGIDGNFYGTTYSGGANSDGTIFEITPGGTLTALHSFNGADGSKPTMNLVQGAGGYLFGVTYTGGANGAGTVFSLSPLQ